MEAIINLERLIGKLLGQIIEPCKDSQLTDFDTRLMLFNLASNTDWKEEAIIKINFLSKRFDISKKFFLAYHSNGRKAVDSQLSDSGWLELAVAIFFKALLISQISSDRALQLRRYNVLFKLLDVIEPEWIAVNTLFKKSMMTNWTNLIKDLEDESQLLPVSLYVGSNREESVRKGSSIPLTVLFYEGPIARAYLETIKSLGLKPQKIIELVAAKDVATKKSVGRFLPALMRTGYASSIQKNKIHFWPKNLIKTHPKFIHSISSEVQDKFSFSKQCIDNANALKPLSDYSDEVESLLVDGLNDPKLLQFLSQEPASALLFTGGGLVPDELLSLQHLRFLHVHPGYLPDIRGADCALWSSLLTGQTSATCFYMSPGIDTGDIIYPCWLPRLSLPLKLSGIERQSIYRAVYGFIDPWVRSFVLREIIEKNAQFLQLSSFSQDESEGNNFHFMSYQLQIAAFGIVFNSFNLDLNTDENLTNGIN
jgi:hypothetical protein